MPAVRQRQAEHATRSRRATTSNRMPTCGDYTMRAQPRRRVAEDKEEPIFLRKTFEMICACDADEAGDLACWTQTGETFVVKDPDVFARVVIPRFFKREFSKSLGWLRLFAVAPPGCRRSRLLLPLLCFWLLSVSCVARFFRQNVMFKQPTNYHTEAVSSLSRSCLSWTKTKTQSCTAVVRCDRCCAIHAPTHLPTHRCAASACSKSHLVNGIVRISDYVLTTFGIRSGDHS